MTSWTAKDITERISALKTGPKHIGFDLIYDEANNIWLGTAKATFWLLENESPQEKVQRHAIAAVGATPVEVLKKLAEMLE